MNMFRNLLTIGCIALAAGLWFGKPDEWRWPIVGGPYVVNAISFLDQMRPLSEIVLLVIATALFMTRKQY
jgi:hypothetical protein